MQVAGLVVTGAVILGGGMASGQTDLAFYGLMFSLFAGGGVLGVSHAFRLQRWGSATDNEFAFLEKVKSTRRFLNATRNSTTPARAVIYGLVHGLRPGHRIELDDHAAVMEMELQQPGGHIRLIGATLVQLGILGTAVGAMESLGDLSDFAAKEKVSAGPELFQDLLGPGSALGGLALAFASTALGLAGNIALRAIAGVLESSAQSYVNHVVELIASFVLPDLWIDGEDEQGGAA